MYDEWENSFSDYMQPRSCGVFFRGKKVLDAGFVEMVRRFITRQSMARKFGHWI